MPFRNAEVCRRSWEIWRRRLADNEGTGGTAPAYSALACEILATSIRIGPSRSLQIAQGPGMGRPLLFR